MGEGEHHVGGLSMIHIQAVRVSMPAPLGDGLTSAIAKRPVTDGELRLTTLNLAGDDQADRTVHGGPDKAVYVHPSEHLPQWAADLDDDTIEDAAVSPFGENLSTAGATEATVNIGDVWHWGNAQLQVCQPRWPCQKLTVHRGTPSVGPLMRSTGRTGWYLRVLEPGTVPTSGTIEVDPHAAGVTVMDAHAAMLDRHLDDRALVERAADLGDVLAAEWLNPLLDRLGRT